MTFRPTLHRQSGDSELSPLSRSRVRGASAPSQDRANLQRCEFPTCGFSWEILRLCYRSSAQLLNQGRAIHSEEFGCAVLVAAGSLQRLLDQPTLELGEQQAQVEAIRG